MPSSEDEELRRLQEDIERRSGEGRSQSAEDLTEAARALHELKQQQTDIKFQDPAQKFEGPLHQPEPDFSKPYATSPNPHAMKMVMEAENTGEPLFCFRARDFFSVQVIAHYAEIVEKYGPDDSDFHRRIIDALGEFKDWQRANVAKVRYPD